MIATFDANHFKLYHANGVLHRSLGLPSWPSNISRRDAMLALCGRPWDGKTSFAMNEPEALWESYLQTLSEADPEYMLIQAALNPAGIEGDDSLVVCAAHASYMFLQYYELTPEEGRVLARLNTQCPRN